eukprot:jgi/Psemu1/185075/e_gw1.44.110.1
MTAPLTAAKTLGTSGKVFFGGLCVGTFGLGCWQLERLLEKWDAIENRDQQLAMTPIRYDSDRIQSSDGLTTTLTDAEHPYRRRLLRGRFRHDKEVLIGPRGAPPGVRLPVSGLSAKQQSGRGGGNSGSGSGSGSTTVASGMQPGPQGFYVLTPLEVEPDGTGTGTANANANANSTGVVWVNRGWVPKTVVPGADRSYSRNDLVQKAKLEAELRDTPPAWNRPSGRVELTAVVSQAEKPRFIIPEHDYSKRPLQLFWIDGLALKAIAADLMTTEERERADTPVVTQVVGCDYESESENENEFDAHTTTQAATTTTQQLLYPLQPPVASVGAFKTTPSVHMGYAATWFGLSGAGWYMTRKLITKGRW